MKHIALPVIAAAIFAIGVSAQESKPAQIDPNKDAYHRAARAASAKTFEGAKLMIDQIDKKSITDPDVASYVDLSSRFANFCSDLGIPRDANEDWSIFKELDYTAILKALTAKGIQNAPARAVELVSEALKLKKQMPIYHELDNTLQKRYGAP